MNTWAYSTSQNVKYNDPTSSEIGNLLVSELMVKKKKKKKKKKRATNSEPVNYDR